MRAVSFCSGYDARACASGPPQNCPHSLPPPKLVWPLAGQANSSLLPSLLSLPGQKPEERGPRDPHDARQTAGVQHRPGRPGLSALLRAERWQTGA